ncbi:MAG: PH domain-containing protein [Stackebrandtia sp.]
MAHLGLVDFGERAWRVPRQIVAVKVAGTAAFALVALWFSDDEARFIVSALAAAVTGAYAVRDLLWPVRLTATGDGVGVSRGFLGRQHVDWGEIVRIRVDQRRRLGTEIALLEIDIDSTLFLFSRYEIGQDPHEAAAALSEMRRNAMNG